MTLKILMMGTGPFAVPTFQALLKSTYEVACLVTRPDKPVRGRQQSPANPMREVADSHGVPVFAPASINTSEGLQLLEQWPTDLFVVCDYGQILSREALGKSTLGGINLHGSLLPKYRGAAPVNWALLNGDTRAGITVIHMTPQLDGGPILCQRALDVGDNEDAVQLETRLAALGVDAVMEAIEMLDHWDQSSPLGTRQSTELVSKAPRLKKSDGQIDWNASARQIFNRVRALKPWPGTFTHLLREDKPPIRVIVDRVSLAAAVLDIPPGFGKSGEDQQILVQCGEGVLCLERLQPAGKRVMEGAEFLRGYGTDVLRFGNAESDQAD